MNDLQFINKFIHSRLLKLDTSIVILLLDQTSNQIFPGYTKCNVYCIPERMSDTESRDKREDQRAMLLRIKSFNRIKNEINLIHHEDLRINPLSKEVKRIIHWQIWNIPLSAVNIHFETCQNAIETNCWCQYFDISGDLPLWSFKQQFLDTYKNITSKLNHELHNNIRLDIERAKNLQSRIENIIFNQLSKLKISQSELYEYRLMKELTILHEIKMFLISSFNNKGRTGIVASTRENIARPVFIS